MGHIIFDHNTTTITMKTRFVNIIIPAMDTQLSETRSMD